MMTFRLTTFLMLLFFSNFSFADTIWMKNGDRLTGTITLLNNNKLVIKTDYAGTITINWGKIATLEVQQPIIVKLSKENQQKINIIKPAKEGKLQLITENTAQQTVALSEVKQIIVPKPLIEDLVWLGKINFSLDSKKAEKNTTTVDFDFQTKLIHGKWRHTLEGEYTRKSTDSNVSTNNYGIDYTLDRFITDKWFWQTNTSFQLDHVEDLYKQYTLGTGPGYQFWDDSLGSFSLASLINISRYEYRERNNRNFTTAGIRWDYNRYLLGKDIELFSTGDLFRPFSNKIAKYALDANTGVRYRLTDWASLNFRINRHTIDADSDANLNETRYIFGFGINW